MQVCSGWPPTARRIWRLTLSLEPSIGRGALLFHVGRDVQPDRCLLAERDMLGGVGSDKMGLVAEDTAQSKSAPPAFVEPTFGQRLLARLIDAVVFLPVALLLGALAEGRARAAAGLALVTVYEILLVSRRGQTVGKIVMGTRIVNRASGSVPSPAHVALRWLVLIAGSLITLVIPAFENVDIVYSLVVLLPILRPPLHRGLHDFAAGTVVTSLRTTPSAG